MKDYARSNPIVMFVIVAVVALACGFGAHKLSQNVAGLDPVPKGTYYMKSDAVTRTEFQSLQADFDRYRGRESIPLSQLPPGVAIPQSPGQTLLNIQKLAESGSAAQSTQFAFAHLSAEMANSTKIDTKLPATGPRMLLYKRLQQVMNIINSQKVPATGDQKAAQQAVMIFQKENGIGADGVLGMGTWKLVSRKYAVALLGGPAAASGSGSTTPPAPAVEPPRAVRSPASGSPSGAPRGTGPRRAF